MNQKTKKLFKEIEQDESLKKLSGATDQTQEIGQQGKSGRFDHFAQGTTQEQVADTSLYATKAQ